CQAAADGRSGVDFSSPGERHRRGGVSDNAVQLTCEKNGFSRIGRLRQGGCGLSVQYCYYFKTDTGEKSRVNGQASQKHDQGIHVFKTNKQKTIGVLKKYMRGAGDDILEETYESTKAGLETVPIPSLEVVKTALEILSYQYPQAKQTDPNLII